MNRVLTFHSPLICSHLSSLSRSCSLLSSYLLFSNFLSSHRLPSPVLISATLPLLSFHFLVSPCCSFPAPVTNPSAFYSLSSLSDILWCFRHKKVPWMKPSTLHLGQLIRIFMHSLLNWSFLLSLAYLLHPPWLLKHHVCWNSSCWYLLLLSTDRTIITSRPVER